MKKKNQICLYPFTAVEIYDNGNVSCCWCPYLNYRYSFGNIFEQSFDEIWNGEKAQTFRQDVLKGKYSYCDLEMCATNGKLCYCTENPNDVSLIAPYPEIVIFSMDHSCNLTCKMCRDDVECNIPSDVSKLNSILDEKLLPMLKNAKIVHPCSRGELFVSKHSLKLVSKATKLYPDLKFCIYTNGMFCDEENIEKLGLHNKIDKLLISIHASHKRTYKKIVRGGDFDKVIRNLKWAASQQAKGFIGEVNMNFVVSSYNYKDMVDFAELAKSLNVIASFWELRNWNTSEMSKNIDEYAIYLPEHPKHNELVEILKNPIFQSRWVCCNDVIKNLCPAETSLKEFKK